MSAAAGTGKARPRVLSGIQPTADSFHFGNYLGAMRQWVDLQEEYEPFFFIAEHARDHRRAGPEGARDRAACGPSRS